MGSPFSGKTQNPPPAPDYGGSAQQQGIANREAAGWGSQLNNPNVFGPGGSQVWAAGPDGRQTLTQSFSPEQQRLYDQQNQNRGLMGDLGSQALTGAQGVVGQPLDFSGMPAAPGSYEGTRGKVIEAMMSRANEDYGKQTDQANSDLIAAGIRPGTKAYGDRMQMIERSRNDARMSAESGAGAEVSRAYGMDDATRRSAISEALTRRQVPLNEATALMSGSQVSNPFAMPGVAQNSQVAPAPLFGATTAQGQYQSDLYNANQTRAGGITSGLFGLGAAAMPYMFGG